MTEELTIALIERPGPDITHTLELGLDEHSREITGTRNEQPFALMIHDASGTTIDGLFAVAFWGWLSIELLWIAKPHRGRGYGHRLLEQAEEEGRRRGATKAFLNTHSFQAPTFYEKHGYEVYGELTDFPPGFTRRYYVKSLAPISG